MRIDVVSIFPEYLAPLELSLIGKARQDGLLELNVHDLRTFTTDKHRTVDDTPYGGGAGMVMKPEPWAQALESIADARSAEAGTAATEPSSDVPKKKPVLIVPSPAGERFNQALAYELAEEDQLVFACGRYEGIDERVMEWAAGHFTVRPVSLGDYVLNGGEVAVLAMVEAIGRLLPGVVGNPESLVEESHSDGLLEYPVYTKPSSWRDRDVPAVLLSGNHGRIAQWRRHEQFRRTAERRPDLLAEFDAGRLTRADRTAFGELGYDVVDGRLRRRPDSELPA
ncbi:tRNA (guanosine(37)-N1)-methyltransferase TrmD [Arthrobacter bambusae]|uniref:tRNA (guanosine(37)-N1)-methyltransferase TrmD n=1 Tax=Arthrobacter TaxID=1663 RepID=UPI001F50EA94|nr:MULTISPECIES: tRNA (guanosine(37)-N1)-methyltransferase TrmD [Arthrobacter]MCI0140641.1 tRNA (guanosine(37)-N1)-methyltransferase TrmD [Arthrobacter bambusae]UYY80164.1 tRNA (guanosine(37)-N1)-methyltransferase TrmD [Arthrobacter sp. YA7-1]